MSGQEKSNDVIDLRQEGVLSIELAQLASQIEVEVRDEYTGYIGGLASTNNITGLEWLVNVTCRNPYQTRIFDNFCKLRLLDHYLQEGDPVDKVRVDGRGMGEAVDALRVKYRARFSVDVDDSEAAWSSVLNLLSKAAVLVYISLVSFLVPRLLCKKRVHPDRSIIYLDTFAKSSSFDADGHFIDRYYPGMVAVMKEEQAARVWYAPVIGSFRTPFDLKRYIDQTQESPDRFLIMEEWLKGSDYLHSLALSFFLPRKIADIPHFCGIDVSSMVRSELTVDFFSTGLFGALLRYRFIHRLQHAGVEIEKVVDWNENQVIDRALCLAVREFYPKVQIIGYQGFIVSKHYLSHEPACYEREAGTVPDTVCVVNKALIERKKKYCAEQQVTVAPAFRFQQLMSYQLVDEGERNVVLLALPVQKEISRMIIQLVLQMNGEDSLRFFVKLHPSVSKEGFLVDVPEADDPRFHFVDSSLYALFPRTVLLLSSDSSACFEAVSCGVRVVIIGNLTGPTSNPLEGIVSPDYWKICYSTDCLLEMLAQRDQFLGIDREELLLPVTRESVAGFLNL